MMVLVILLLGLSNEDHRLFHHPLSWNGNPETLPELKKKIEELRWEKRPSTDFLCEEFDNQLKKKQNTFQNEELHYLHQIRESLPCWMRSRTLFLNLP